MRMQTIAIVGLGLIGGSLGLDFVGQGYTVIGIARRQETCQQALDRGVVHQATTALHKVQSADVVFVCTPIHVVVDTIKALVPHLKPGAMVTDVASVKGQIVSPATQLWPNFVGGHPMAGKAEAGLEVAEAGLFAGRPYVLTPMESTTPKALQQVKVLVQQLRCTLYECQPDAHDQAVAWISHLPVMVSSCLIQACQGEANPAILALAKSFASSGFRDTSRVGGGDPQLGLMMARYNRKFLLACLQGYQTQLLDLMDCIRREDWDHLFEWLHTTQTDRKEFIADP
jgi:arogenate dehydrogenase (NADP+)